MDKRYLSTHISIMKKIKKTRVTYSKDHIGISKKK